MLSVFLYALQLPDQNPFGFLDCQEIPDFQKGQFLSFWNKLEDIIKSGYADR